MTNLPMKLGSSSRCSECMTMAARSEGLAAGRPGARPRRESGAALRMAPQSMGASASPAHTHTETQNIHYIILVNFGTFALVGPTARLVVSLPSAL